MNLKSETMDPRLKVPPRGLVLRIFTYCEIPSSIKTFYSPWRTKEIPKMYLEEFIIAEIGKCRHEAGI